MTKNDLITMQRFSINKVYLKLIGDYPKVTWRKITRNNPGFPKWIFILYLAINRRLYTKDRLISWGMPMSPLCALCGIENETIDQLFFKCSVSASVWEKLLRWQGINRATLTWEEELLCCETGFTGKNCTTTMYRITLATAIYELWI
ncbi:uncharacterized protein LOC132613172 [Lycium barbarum]|uniref:uncharacterized protein LOC132613172 n=1 Tax=Lycium barbarum TaxID=112863 RepID=UPI00293E24E2|nr:uncharacterized protein LOC132613172 [Lycium barbarum]